MTKPRRMYKVTVKCSKYPEPKKFWAASETCADAVSRVIQAIEEDTPYRMLPQSYTIHVEIEKKDVV